MTKTTNGGPRVLDLTRHEIVRAGMATPDEEERYFEEVVKPVWDARHSTEKEGGMQPWEKFVMGLAADAPRTPVAADMSEDDRLYERFAADSGLNDLTGRVPGTREAADLSAPTGEGVETSASADMSDAAMWSAFVETTGFEETAPASPGGKAADLSEDGDDDGGPSLSDEEAWAQYAEAVGLDR